jgi:tetratricopeptide (TPR) repeat protein
VELAAPGEDDHAFSVQDVVETYTESMIVMDTTTETTEAALAGEDGTVEAASEPEEVAAVASALIAEGGSDQAVAAAVDEETNVAAPSTETVEEVVAAEVNNPEPAAAVEETSVAEPVAEPLNHDVAEVDENLVEVAAASAEESAVAESMPENVEEVSIAVEESSAEPMAASTVTRNDAAGVVEESALEPQVAEASPVTEETNILEQEEAVSSELVPAASVPQHAAYEEFLKDDGNILNTLAVAEPDQTSSVQELPIPAEPATKIDASGEFHLEMDTKNAHVWNELGNVYFNNGAVDDSIVAYSKAIELDRWFAWPYSNLALAYVQKGRFAEAVLLYQRSIELFTGEKDKAISWNRLGNVYRRMNDYDNAIAAYQRADELDPDNTTLSLQSRFSLLGSYQLEQNASYVA